MPPIFCFTFSGFASYGVRWARVADLSAVFMITSTAINEQSACQRSRKPRRVAGEYVVSTMDKFAPNFRGKGARVDRKLRNLFNLNGIFRGNVSASLTFV